MIKLRIINLNKIKYYKNIRIKIKAFLIYKKGNALLLILRYIISEIQSNDMDTF